jgi:hypothetical protein
VFWHSIGKLYQTWINDRFYCVADFITLQHDNYINNVPGVHSMYTLSKTKRYKNLANLPALLLDGVVVKPDFMFTGNDVDVLYYSLLQAKESK